MLVVSPSWMAGAPAPVCIVYLTANYWLRQPTHVVLAHLASELGVDVAAPPGAADPEATDVLPRIESEPGDAPTQPLQTPAIPPPPTAPVGRPDQDHGGVGVKRPERPRPRCGPSDNLSISPRPGQSLLLNGGITWAS